MNELPEMHPEDLLDRAALGVLSTEQRRLLEAHVATCDACAAQVRLLDDFEREEAEAGEDAALAGRAVTAALAAIDGAPETKRAAAAVTGARAAGVRRWPRLLLAALVLVLVAGGVATAWMLTRPAAEGSRGGPPDAHEARRAKRPTTEEPVIALDEVHVEGSAEDDAPNRRRRRPRAVEPAPTAAELLAQANAARRAGREGDAAELYRQLQRAHASSREARVSRIAFGRLLLDRSSDPAGALAQFDAYLAGAGDATLAEEARVGRAMALRRLGRSAAERAAWEDVIAHHPRSAHVPLARERIRELNAAP